MRESTPRTAALMVLLTAVLSLLVPTSVHPSTSGSVAPPTVVPRGDPGSSALTAAATSLARGAGPSDGRSWSCSAAAPGISSSCRLASSIPSTGAPGWVYGGPGPGVNPSGQLALLAYDAADGYVVLADGFDSRHATIQTWTYASSEWQPLNLSFEPSGCQGSHMVYDTGDGYVFLVEGANCTDEGLSYAFVHGSWGQVSGSPSPSTRIGAAVANDPAEDEVLLFGGELYPSGNVMGDTWAYRAGAWTNLTAELNGSPPARRYASLSYDTAGGTLVLFGGLGGAPSNDTWEFSGGEWTELLPPSAPPPEYGATLVDDPIAAEVLLFGGVNLSGIATPEDWAFQNGSWSAIGLLPTGAVGLVRVGVAFDPAVGGVIAAFPPSGGGTIQEIWEYRAGAWTNLTEADLGPSPAILTYDGADGYVVLYDGATWAYSDGGWSELLSTGGPGTVEAMTYDAADGYVLAWAGANQTWEYVNATWSELTPVLSPPVLSISDPQLSYDPAEGFVVYYAAHNVTWAYSKGVWTNVSSSSGSPAGVPTGPLVYDPSLSGVLLAGAWTIQGANATFVNDTWLFTNGSWEDLHRPVPGLEDPSAGQMFATYDSSSGGVLLFELGSLWQFTNLTWSLLASPTNEGPSAAQSLGGDPASGNVLLVEDGTWWAWSPSVNASRPVVERFVAAPNPSETGQPVNLSVVALGGVPPLSYAYSGLPSGCAPVNRSSLSCTPEVAGTFDLTAVVTDSAGNSSSGKATLVVLHAVFVSLQASPASVQVGKRTLLEATAIDGTPPYTYVYSGLPPGCTSQDVPTLPCTPGAVGTPSVTVQVTDGDGSSASSSIVLTVVAAGVPGGPQITSFEATPPELVLGNSTVLEVTLSDGAAPVSYLWGGLPAGCSPGDRYLLTCQPAAAGTFTVTVAVTNLASGVSAEADLTLAVGPEGRGGGPYVESFQAFPSTFLLGNATLFLVETLSATNGSGAVSYSYVGLPTGCATENVTRLACAPRVAGVFTVTVIVGNGFGNRTEVATEVTVSPGPTAPGPHPAPLLSWFLGAGLAGAGGATVWAVDHGLQGRRRREGTQWVRELTHDGGETGGPPSR